MFVSNFVPRASLPLTSGRKTSIHFEITKTITEFCPSGSLRNVHLWRMPEMVAPRGSRFPTTDQGERSSGNEIGLWAAHSMESDSKWFSTNPLPYFCWILNSFVRQFLWFLQLQSCFILQYRKNEAKSFALTKLPSALVQWRFTWIKTKTQRNPRDCPVRTARHRQARIVKGEVFDMSRSKAGSCLENFAIMLNRVHYVVLQFCNHQVCFFNFFFFV